MQVYDPFSVLITLDEIVDLTPGVHIFTITNVGETPLLIELISLSDTTYTVTQPLVSSLDVGESTTFTVTAP